MRICVTNDDGVGTVGLMALARGLRAAGHDVVVVAPQSERSGAGTGLGLRLGGDALHWHTTLEGDVRVLAMDGPPAMCVIAALEGLAGAVPDLVASGINHGPNLGFAVAHSGTVGAALTAHIAGVPGFAISVGEPRTGPHTATWGADDPRWAAAVSLAAALVERVADWGCRWVPNLNVPTSWDGSPVRCCRLARLGAIGLATATDDSAVISLRSHADLTESTESDVWPSDVSANALGHATLTPLSGIGTAHVEREQVEALMTGGAAG
jgi:5'-nucleotidase